ncbi:uncharacterized protein LOC114960135 [Acropora millepora]|uniref:uncharacterized protein LOC114960135 n=1 Tax=Acropora millepora TaxID=45264 RepID=UPI001CF54C7E|nr:uncharacterized protein LOC114960135 [Acropora millepora]
MASPTTKLPSWLLLSKEDIAKSSEWNDLTSELFDAVKQQIAESHVSKFSDLTDSEKILFLDRAARLVRDGSSYKNLVQRVSGILDRNLNEDVVQTIFDPSNKYTKTQLLLEGASEATIKLLQRWPDLRTKMYTCLNRPLPNRLRKAMWKMCLADPIVRQRFLERALSNKRDTGSAQDAIIGQKCQAFLSSEEALREFASRPAVVEIMKSALSHRQFTTMGASSLVDTDFLLVLPFLKSLVLDSDVNQVDSQEIADFVEVYCTFMESRPPLMKDSRSKEFLVALTQYGKNVAAVLESKDQHLASSLQRVFSQGKSDQMAEGLAALMRSCARCMFVGFLSLNVVCYIWDQYILNLKLRSFHCIAMFSAAMLMLLREKLLRCRNVKEAEGVLLSEGKTLSVRDFQQMIDRHFLEDWQKQVTQDYVDRSELPLVDPVATVGRSMQPWSMWFLSQPPSRQRVEDRRLTREQREEERKRKLIEQQREEARRRREEEAQTRRREQEMRREFQEEKNKERKQIAALERELERERTQRVSAEKQKNEEISRLKSEIAKYQVTPAHTPGGIPSTSNTGPSIRDPAPVPPRSQPRKSPRQEAEEFVRALLGGAFHSLELVAHGSRQERTNLDVMTRKALETNSKDYREAMVEVFNRELHTDDWDRMEEEERSEKTTRLMTVLKEKRQERLNGIESQR